MGGLGEGISGYNDAAGGDGFPEGDDDGHGGHLLMLVLPVVEAGFSRHTLQRTSDPKYRIVELVETPKPESLTCR